LFGPPRVDPSWQARAGGYAAEQFAIDWEKKAAICPEGKASTYWYEQRTREEYEREVVKIRFRRRDCLQCGSRGKCVKSTTGAARMMIVPTQPLYESLKRMRQKLKDEEGRREYRNRAASKRRSHRRCGVPARDDQDTKAWKKLSCRRWRQPPASMS
jgi:hypothetical protein